MSADIDCLVVGAGVVGLAIARALARAGRDVVVVERERAIGQGVSSRNSEVVHAGIYYTPGSLKARLCIEGRELLYGFCRDHDVPHARCGKIIVATSTAQLDTLRAIAQRAHANGAKDVREIGRADMQAMEPELEGVLGLVSPSTGIVDTHALMLTLEGDAAAHGASVAFATPFLGASSGGGSQLVVRLGGDEACEVSVNTCVLAAGLSSPRLAGMIDGIAPATIPVPHFAKGNYFTLGRRSPFSRLIYPVPEPGGLGIHLTIDLAARARFGPDVEWLDVQDDRAIDYSVDPSRADQFYRSIRRYWPGLRDSELLPDYSGVRPKIVARGAPESDFVVQGQDVHGVPGLVALYGIESPGLTSALAIAGHVADLIAAEARA